MGRNTSLVLNARGRVGFPSTPSGEKHMFPAEGNQMQRVPRARGREKAVESRKTLKTNEENRVIVYGI